MTRIIALRLIFALIQVNNGKPRTIEANQGATRADRAGLRKSTCLGAARASDAERLPDLRAE